MSGKEKNLKLNATENFWDYYFDHAEDYIDGQWKNLIWPRIQSFDFTSVLELAPGAGRNTEKLVQFARNVVAVDINETAINKLRTRFEEIQHDSNLSIIQNDGINLSFVPSNSITLIYCWDAAVHFDKEVLIDYLGQFNRILKKGGKGFIHHSNLGEMASDDISQNPGWRSNFSAEKFAKECKKNALNLIDQIDLEWGKITDCISIFGK